MIIALLCILFLFLIIEFLCIWFLFKRIENIYLNIYSLSKGMDELFSNENKIVELTGLKGFIQLVSKEEDNIKSELKNEIIKEKTKHTEKSV